MLDSGLPGMRRERRTSPRTGVDYAVRLRVEEQVHSGRLTSLSRMGALVVVDRPVAVGTRLVLELELSDGTGAMTARGQVVRVQASGTEHALGLLFAPLAQATLALIDSLIAS